MPFYQDIDPSTNEGKRTLRQLLELRKQLTIEIPEKHLDSNLLMATWNIREFGTDKYGGRRSESLYYIAEIIARFDIIAVQEVRKDLATLKKLMGILGSNYEYMFTDVTDGKAGNQERLTFIFDTRKVRFGGLAGEMVLAPLEQKDPTTGQVVVTPSKQLARTPYMCGFKAGWTNFVLTTVHILYGEAAAEDPHRVEEIRQLAQAMAKRANGKYEWSENIILLGDFNIFSPKDSTLKAITDEGFLIPKPLQSLKGSNVEKNKFYDQIAFKVRPNRFETSGKAGIFDFYKTVMRLDQEKEYAESMGADYETDSSGKPRKNKTAYYKTYWRTFQMSDHLPMWVEVLIDHTDSYMQYKLLPKQTEDGDIPAPSKSAKAKTKKPV
jgi:endonuclease/exonuclease/phosphatase family metal-dependent hydrolase